MRYIVLGLAAVLGGCATVDEPIRLGSNSYTISAKSSPFHGGEKHSLQAAIDKANSFCVKQGEKEAKVTFFGGAGFGRSSVNFICVPN